MRTVLAKRRRVGLFVVLLACLLTSPTARAGELTAERYDEVLTELTPPVDEPWRTIPWGLSVLEAQRVAVEAGKPIFIWAMDGHPLGCV